MNITGTEEPLEIIAKTCGLCIDKKDIISAELEACERLLKYTADKEDEETIKKEIAELKMALDLMH
jgi:hypothetical protein